MGLTPAQANPPAPGSPARPAAEFARDRACVRERHFPVRKRQCNTFLRNLPE
ncbi:hypothetical protein HispidOSU_022758 [Sigmodon hispidus]